MGSRAAAGDALRLVIPSVHSGNYGEQLSVFTTRWMNRLHRDIVDRVDRINFQVIECVCLNDVRLPDQLLHDGHARSCNSAAALTCLIRLRSPLMLIAVRFCRYAIFISKDTCR